MATQAVTINTKELEKAFGKLAKQQMPFAIAKALTDTAKDAQRALEAQLPKKLDRPTAFTKNAFTVIPATKRRHIATVLVKDHQEKYLKYQILGGLRKAKEKKLAIPAGINLNKFGNIAGMRGGKKIAALLKKPNVFQGTINGTDGVWQRYKNGKIKLLIKYVKEQEHTERFPFDKIVKGVAKSKLEHNLKKALFYAVQTAR